MLGTWVILAAGLFVADSGTEARAMGGTGVASSNSPMAVWYNPAGLAGQEGAAVLLDLNMLVLQSSFTRAGIDPNTSGAYAAVDGERPLQWIPALLATYGWGESASPFLRKLTLAGGVVTPTGPRYEYPTDGAQRYNLTELYLIQANYGFWAGYQLNSWIALGFGLEGLAHTVDQDLMVTSALEDDLPTEDPSFDQILSVSVSKKFAPSGVLGLNFTPPGLPGWSFGASYRPGASLQLPGSLEIPSLSVRDVSVEARMNIPAVARMGVSYARPDWHLALDVVVEDWSNFQDIVIDIDDDEPVLVLGVASEVVIHKGFRQASSVRLGGAKVLGQDWKVMGGYFYESSAVPDETLGVDSIDADKHGVSAGVGYSMGALTLSSAYSFVSLADRTIANSQVKQLAPFFSEADDVVGNGDYSGQYHMLSWALLFRY